ncbi:SKA complex subunit 1 [Megalopta genalis]|uniref:SKA complex subunit 1 n=1 Tax=Megalopta genalis TaxID=115081 RepID=UPI0014435BB2|nr:spindle and kinetochore-associated protein 1-like [Megalopta genalis]
MANSCCIDEILKQLCDKLQYLESATMLHKIKHEIKDELLEMYEQISDISDDIDVLRKQLHKISEQNKECQELLLLIQNLDDKIVHMEQNVPPTLIHDFHHSENELNHVLKEILALHYDEEISVDNKSDTDTDTKKQTEARIKDCKKILFDEPVVYPRIDLITKNEFDSIPKYIIGRQSLETLNNLVDAINQVLKAKYTLLSMGKAQVRKQGNMNLYLHYKEQDLDICNGNDYVYFFTKEDYETHMKVKLNKIKLNLITVLRHCKRLREYRVKNDLRYIVVTE